MSASESPAHRELKRLALIWAQAHDYPIAACEVSLPNLRCRIDVGAYRPGPRRSVPIAGSRRVAQAPSLGLTAIFECKASRADLVRDCRNSRQLLERIKELTTRRTTLERLLQIDQPSLRRGDALWPEYETFAFAQAEHEPYRKVLKVLATLSRQLHGQTKMESLFKWESAHLHYLVVEPGLVEAHEVPVGWGLLVRNEQRLDLVIRPERREVYEEKQLTFLHRVAAAATKAVNRETGITYKAIEDERRGLSPRAESSPARV